METDAEMLARLLTEAESMPDGQPGLAFPRAHSDRERRVFREHIERTYGLGGDDG